MYIKRKDGKIIKVKTNWDLMNEQAQLIIQKTSLASGVGADAPSSSGSAA